MKIDTCPVCNALLVHDNKLLCLSGDNISKIKVICSSLKCDYVGFRKYDPEVIFNHLKIQNQRIIFDITFSILLTLTLLSFGYWIVNSL